MKKFSGVFPPMITIFTSDFEVDEAATREHIDFLIDKGASGMIPCGSTGEFPTLSPAERRKVIEFTIDQVNGRVPVVAGTSSTATDETIEISRFAQDAGSDGVLIVPPYYYKLTEDEIYQHYKAVSDAIDIPIMLYNNPWVCGTYVYPPLVARMARDGILQYVKETHGDLSYVHESIQKGGKDLTLFFGRDENSFEALMIGAKGWVSGGANLVIEKEVEIFRLVKEGKIDEAREKYFNILPFFYLTERKGRWIARVKAGLRMIGREAGDPKPPLLPLNEEEKAELRNVMIEIGMLSE
ncbi:MAG: 4-hydroxy-tetrahydrodipicolinate synthase [Candidatus Krumholzibacteria bacterium]|nr:4-hydroxy-tetrahydrodipicolinate synthase [Candidatus Krumholzibacteria bacterium]